ncbi:unnamed protein product [Linum tenue]|nr:unnamed protein product [Linum tenue]
MEAPNLEHLYLLKFGELQFMGSSSPLSCVHSVYEKTLVDDDGVEYRHHDGPRRIGLLTQISNAKEMLLSWQTLNFLTFVNDNVAVQPLLPVFRDLTHFTVRPSENSSRYSDTKLARSSFVLHSLLNSASKLQHLVIDMGNRRIRMEWEDAEELAYIPECMLSSLEEIEIQNLKADEDERKMVAYLLKAGAVLKKVNLHLFEDVVDYDLGDMEDRLELASLLKLPRRSSTCEAHLFLPNGDEIHIDSNM